MVGIESDYTDHKFNALTVIRLVGTVKHGRNNVKVWLCCCDCGRTLEVDQASLLKGHVPACKVCRRGPCVICGSDITDESFSVKRNTCSEACKKEQLRRRHLKRYNKLVSENPNHNKERYQERLAANPNIGKEKYTKKKERESKLSEEEVALIKAKENKASTESRSKWREKTKAEDPEVYEEFLQRARRSQRKHHQLKEISKLRRLSDKLSSKEDDI